MRRAKREGWQCGAARADVESRTREIVTGNVTGEQDIKAEMAVEVEAQGRAAVILRQREEAQELREALFRALGECDNSTTLEERRAANLGLRAVKVGAQALWLLQGAERRAWRLDEPDESPRGRVEIDVSW